MMCSELKKKHILQCEKQVVMYSKAKQSYTMCHTQVAGGECFDSKYIPLFWHQISREQPRAVSHLHVASE